MNNGVWSQLGLYDNTEEVRIFSPKETLFDEAKEIFKIQSIFYLSINLPNPNYNNYFIQHTYGSEWENCYLGEKLIQSDPIVKHGMKNMLPTDWGQIKPENASEKRFFEIADEFEIGNQGLTFTVRGPNAKNAILSINSNHDKQEWPEFKKQHTNDLQFFATTFHEKVIHSQAQRQKEQQQKLSYRELDCLYWCVVGKSYWETSVILGITERTVSFHMAALRQKLNATTNAQAVAIAIKNEMLVI